MTVILSLDKHRQRKQRPCCPRCVLDAFADRLRNRIDHNDTLLVARTELEDVLTDLLATTRVLQPPAHREDRPDHG